MFTDHIFILAPIDANRLKTCKMLGLLFSLLELRLSFREGFFSLQNK